MKSPTCSKLVLQLVGSWAYLLAHVLNKTVVHNKETFDSELRRIEAQIYCDQPKEPHPKQEAPLLTYSNHISCIDDPILWGSLLPFSYYTTNTKSIRWSAAAVEICFSKPWHSTFFSLGKTFPIIRGIGVNQPGMEFAAGLLNNNQWLHLFPEGKVMRDQQQNVISNKDKGYIFKWGISKLILDYFYSFKSQDKTSNKTLRLLPFYHLGLDEILPIGWPYVPRLGKQITIAIRPKVIEMNSVSLEELLKSRAIFNRKAIKSESEDNIRRIKLTNYLEDEMEKLIATTSELHRKG